MAVNRDLVPWLCHRSLLLYTEGWVQSYAPPVRLRRAKAEAWLLSHSNPIIVPGELIVGQPDFSPFDAEEEKRFQDTRWLYGKVIPPRLGRADHLALDYTDLLDKGVCGILPLPKLDEVYAIIAGYHE